MTIPGFGRITPIQRDLLVLAGYRLTRSKALNGSLVPDDERVSLMCKALQSLRQSTGADFGFDLSAWEAYLMSDPDSLYRHPYAFSETRKRIAAAIADPQRRRRVQGLDERVEGAGSRADREGDGRPT
jgi:hypothetical protein